MKEPFQWELIEYAQKSSNSAGWDSNPEPSNDILATLPFFFFKEVLFALNNTDFL